MSGSEFEREDIFHDALSAAPDSKPVEVAREHSWRPPAELVTSTSDLLAGLR